MPRSPVAVLGGTFDRLHVGHAALLATALAVGHTVAVGLTTAAYLRAHPKPDGGRIQAYAVRRRALARWLRRHAPAARWRIVPLENRFGRSIEDGIDVLVVSADTAGGGAAVNRERRRLGRPRIPVVVVPLVLADDLLPVSSRRIRAGTIDRHGRRRSPLAVGLAAAPSDRAAAVRGVRDVFPSARIRAVPLPPGRSARARAVRAAERARRGHDLGVAVVRAGAGRWWFAERSAAVALSPRPGTGALRAGVARRLRPGRAAGKGF